MSDLSMLLQLKELANAFREAKKAEETAVRTRIQAEERIASLIPTKDVGQKTITLSCGTKITVKRGLNYKADIDGIQRHCLEMGGKLSLVKMKTTRELAIDAYEWTRINDPESFAFVSQYVTVTPKKVAVTIKAG